MGDGALNWWSKLFLLDWSSCRNRKLLVIYHQTWGVVTNYGSTAMTICLYMFLELSWYGCCQHGHPLLEYEGIGHGTAICRNGAASCEHGSINGALAQVIKSFVLSILNTWKRPWSMVGYPGVQCHSWTPIWSQPSRCPSMAKRMAPGRFQMYYARFRSNG